jgi:hypothetical protein
MSESDEREAVTREQFEQLQKEVYRLGELIGRLRKYAPGPAEKTARRNRFIYEVCGLVIVSSGAAFVYPPAALLLIGGWMLADVIVSRNKPKKDR